MTKKTQRHRQRPLRSAVLASRLVIPFAIVGLSVLALAATAVQAAPNVGEGWHSTLDTALAEATRKQSEGKPGYLLVDLYADWCGWCKKLDRDVFSTTTFKTFAKDYSLLRVDTEDGAEGASLKSRFRVDSLPMTLVLTAAGSLVGEVPGYMPTQEMIAEIEKRVSSYEELLGGFEQWRASGEVQILNTLAEQFHERLDGGRSAELYRKILEILPPDSSDATWVRFRLADALRLWGRFDAAHDALGFARKSAAESADTDFLEQVDLLGIRIAQDMGDCDQTTQVLKNFLSAHPKSSYVPLARRTLEEQHCT